MGWGGDTCPARTSLSLCRNAAGKLGQGERRWPRGRAGPGRDGVRGSLPSAAPQDTPGESLTSFRILIYGIVPAPRAALVKSVAYV